MKKRVTFTVDEAVYEGLKSVPRGVSVSEIINWLLRAMVEDVKPNGMSEDEFINFMDNDPRGREVRQYLKEKIGPIVKNVDDRVEKIKKTIKHKGSK